MNTSKKLFGFVVLLASLIAHAEGPDILLVTNRDTTPQELKAWHALAARSGKNIEEWNVSSNHFLDFDRSISQGENLLNKFHGKTVVILNNPFKTIEGDKHSDELMGQMDLIRATASHGIRILVINEEKHQVESLMSDRLIPTDTEVEYGYRDLKSYLAGEPQVSTKKGEAVELAEIFKPEAKDAQARRNQVKINPTDTTGQIPIVGYGPPDNRRLQAQAVEIQKSIEARMPGSRVVVSYELSKEGQEIPAYAKQKGAFGDYQYHGMLTIRPTVNDMQPNILVLNAPAAAIHDSAFIEGEGVNAALVQSFNFEDKLSALDKVMAELAETPESDSQFGPRQALGRSLVDGILIDLAVEQGAVLRYNWKSGASSQTLTDSMAYLNRIGHYQTKLDLSKPSAAADLMADLVGGIRFLSKNQALWYEKLLLPGAPLRRGPVVSAHTKKMGEQLANEIFGPAASRPTALSNRLNDRVKELTERRNEMSIKRHHKLSQNKAAELTLMDPLLSKDVRMDALYTFNRVFSQNKWNTISQGEAEIEKARRDLQAGTGGSRRDDSVVPIDPPTGGKQAGCDARFAGLGGTPDTSTPPPRKSDL